MNILITGAKGMVGTALVANLKNIKGTKNRTRPNLHIDEIYEYDIDSTRRNWTDIAGKQILSFICRGEPPKEPGGIYEREFWFCF